MGLIRQIGLFLSGAGYRQEGLQGSTPAYRTRSAVPVTLDSALQLSAVWASVKLISESVASLPIYLYEKKADGSRQRVRTHNLSYLFDGKVNKWQTKQEYLESLSYQFVLLGNSYSAIQRNSRKEIISLIPLMSEQMQVVLLDNGDVSYKYQTKSEIKVYSQASIMHNKLFGNGIVGLSPLEYARNSFGVSQATEEQVSNIYRNGGKPSGILSMDKLLTEEQRNKIKANFSELSSGNEDRLFVLEAGMSYNQVSLSPQDIELLSSRRFNVEDIARFFGVPSVLINDTQTGTTWGSGIDQIIQGFYKFNLKPYLTRLKASMECNLLTPEERNIFEIEFDLNALLRPDKSERIKANKEAIMSGQMTPNEARLTEGFPSVEGGDKIMMQSQMAPVESLPLKGQPNIGGSDGKD